MVIGDGLSHMGPHNRRFSDWKVISGNLDISVQQGNEGLSVGTEPDPNQ